MSKSNKFVFQALNVVAWIIFVGLCIEAGALLVNFVYSLFKPEVVKNLYEKLDLSQIYNLNKWVYFGLYGFILFISGLKAYLFYAVIVLLGKLDMEKAVQQLCFSTYYEDQLCDTCHRCYQFHSPADCHESDSLRIRCISAGPILG